MVKPSGQDLRTTLIFHIDEGFMNRMSGAAVLGALLLGVPAVAGAQNTPEDQIAAGRRYTEWFLAGQTDSLRAHMTPAAARALTAESFLQSLDQLVARAGLEDKILEEKMVRRNGQPQYWRTSKFTLFDEPIMIRWVIVDGNLIDGIGMNPKSQAPPVDPPR